MKLGTTIHKFTNSLGISQCNECVQMERDFNNAQYPSDYLNAVLDRIRKRGKYKKENKDNANDSN